VRRSMNGAHGDNGLSANTFSEQRLTCIMECAGNDYPRRAGHSFYVGL
jgi:hypothetical protein